MFGKSVNNIFYALLASAALFLVTTFHAQAGMINTAIFVTTPSGPFVTSAFPIVEGSAIYEVNFVWHNNNLLFPITFLDFASTLIQSYAEADDEGRIITFEDVYPYHTILGWDYNNGNPSGRISIPAGGDLVDQIWFAAPDDGGDDSFSGQFRFAEIAKLTDYLIYSDFPGPSPTTTPSKTFTIDLEECQFSIQPPSGVTSSNAIQCPEPSTVYLMTIGLFTFGFARRSFSVNSVRRNTKI